MRVLNHGLGLSFLALFAFLAWVGLACSAPVALPPALVGPAPTPLPGGANGALETPTAIIEAGEPRIEIWDGMITSETSRQYRVNGSPINLCQTNWSTSLAMRVEPDGRVTGAGDATLSEANCSPHALSGNTNHFSLLVAGNRDASAFHLRLSFLRYEPEASAEYGGFNLVFSSNACSESVARQLDIPLTGPQSASGELAFEEQMSGCAGSAEDLQSAQNTITLRFRFYCDDLASQQKETALGKLCN